MVSNILKNTFKKVGSGAYADVYGKPERKHAVKVFFSHDEPYKQYLNLTKNIQNPHFPQIKGTPKKLNNRVHMVQMEKLHRLDREQHHIAYKASEYADAVTFGEHDSPEHHEFKENFPHLVQAIHHIHNHIVKKNKGAFGFDLHAGNFMQRHDGTVVITDPVFDGTHVNYRSNRDKSIQINKNKKDKI